MRTACSVILVVEIETPGTAQALNHQLIPQMKILETEGKQRVRRWQDRQEKQSLFSLQVSGMFPCLQLQLCPVVKLDKVEPEAFLYLSVFLSFRDVLAQF
jgi:hypothetical protein